jgi:cell division FtsZ-interacting protein ZapD
MAEYEQPINERMRTFMRLEFLYLQMLYNSEQEADWATRGATSSLLEIMAILTRGDVRSDILKELDNQIEGLRRFQSQPEVDLRRLETLVANLATTRDELDAAGVHYLQPLKDCEFLSSIKHRSAIPGGTCEFDLPEYSHWLRQPFTRRQQDVHDWLGNIRPVCDAVVELLWLIRYVSAPYSEGHDLPAVAGQSPRRQPALSGNQRQPAPLHGALSRVVDHRQPCRADRARRRFSYQHLLIKGIATKVAPTGILLARWERL